VYIKAKRTTLATAIQHNVVPEDCLSDANSLIKNKRAFQVRVNISRIISTLFFTPDGQSFLTTVF
jgi:hypothetical protein